MKPNCWLERAAERQEQVQPGGDADGGVEDFLDHVAGDHAGEGGARDRRQEHQQHHERADVGGQHEVERHGGRVAGVDLYPAHRDPAVGEAQDRVPGVRGGGRLQRDQGDPGEQVADRDLGDRVPQVFEPPAQIPAEEVRRGPDQDHHQHDDRQPAKPLVPSRGGGFVVGVIDVGGAHLECGGSPLRRHGVLNDHIRAPDKRGAWPCAATSCPAGASPTTSSPTTTRPAEAERAAGPRPDDPGALARALLPQGPPAAPRTGRLPPPHRRLLHAAGHDRDRQHPRTERVPGRGREPSGRSCRTPAGTCRRTSTSRSTPTPPTTR